MSKAPNRYPVKTTDFCKQVYSEGWRSRRSMRAATRHALRKTTAPLLEVGGPTSKGYVALDGLKLPHGIIISNIEREEGVDVLADVRRLPFAERSLGGIVMQGLTRIPEEIAKAPAERRDLPSQFWPELMADDGNVFGLLFNGSKGDYSGWGDQEIMNYSLRLAMLKEARRTVEPNGVLLAGMLSGGEIRLAEQLGFEMTASTISKIDMHAMHYNRGEMLMTLTNMDTPAGRFVENLPVAAIS